MIDELIDVFLSYIEYLLQLKHPVVIRQALSHVYGLVNLNCMTSYLVLLKYETTSISSTNIHLACRFLDFIRRFYKSILKLMFVREEAVLWYAKKLRPKERLSMLCFSYKDIPRDNTIIRGESLIFKLHKILIDSGSVANNHVLIKNEMFKLIFDYEQAWHRISLLERFKLLHCLTKTEYDKLLSSVDDFTISSMHVVPVKFSEDKFLFYSNSRRIFISDSSDDLLLLKAVLVNEHLLMLINEDKNTLHTLYEDCIKSQIIPFPDDNRKSMFEVHTKNHGTLAFLIINNFSNVHNDNHTKKELLPLTNDINSMNGSISAIQLHDNQSYSFLESMPLELLSCYHTKASLYKYSADNKEWSLIHQRMDLYCIFNGKIMFIHPQTKQTMVCIATGNDNSIVEAIAKGYYADGMSIWRWKIKEEALKLLKNKHRDQCVHLFQVLLTDDAIMTGSIIEYPTGTRLVKNGSHYEPIHPLFCEKLFLDKNIPFITGHGLHVVQAKGNDHQCYFVLCHQI